MSSAAKVARVEYVQQRLVMATMEPPRHRELRSGDR